MREQPNEKSREIRQLPLGTALADLGEVSRFLSGILLADSLRQEPWLRVQTSEGEAGWVFAGAVQPEAAGAAEIRRWLLAKRFEAWFGPVLAQRWQRWQELPEPQSDSLFSVQLREGLALRDTLNLLISRKVTRDAGNPFPDFFWLNEASPFFIGQQIAQGTNFYLFLDYRAIGRRAQRTQGQEDDRFAALGYAAYPTDSIESPLPAWVFPLSTEASCSNLGQGQHLAMLQQLGVALTAGRYFKPELLRLKEAVLEDFLNQKRSFWQPREKILAELDAIRAAAPSCLSDRDWLAIEAQRAIFQQADAGGMKLNLRAGE
ncbi:MAG: SH3 domain-containing protein [Saprospiraceae bacterium]|nr:SH3 domain-containing protein [Saprospiraceae bacterium]